ncbi:MAG: VWA domain-containing protein [Oscillospiraceae bacterium]|nr:VWA domain-containing protein [Oscillospiraceae bacterium]
MENLFFERVRKHQNEGSAEVPTFQEIAASPVFHRYLSNMMHALADEKAMSLKLVLLTSQPGEKTPASHIDGNVISIDVNNMLTRNFAAYQNKMYALLGYLFHEMAHLLYPDFHHENVAFAALQSGCIPYADSPHAAQLDPAVREELLDALQKEEFTGFFINLYSDIANVISDAHDEDKLCRAHSSFVQKSIMTLREGLFTNLPALETLTEHTQHAPLTVMIALLLQYARFGKVFVLREETVRTSPYMSLLRRTEGWVDLARQTDLPEVKFCCINAIVETLWPILRISLLPQMDFDRKWGFRGDQGEFVEKGDSGEEADEENHQKGKSDKKGMSGDDADSEKGNDGDSGGGNQEAEGENNSENSDDVGGIASRSSGTRKGGGGGQGGQSAEHTISPIQQLELAVESLGGESFSAPPVNMLQGEDDAPSIGESKEKFAEQEHKEENTEKAEQNMRSMLSSIVTDMRKDSAEQQAAEEQITDVLMQINTGNMSSPHYGITIDMKKSPVRALDRGLYERVAKANRSLINRIVQEVDKIIREEGVTIQKHRYVGRDIDAKSAYKVDQRYFTQKKDPEKLLDMAVTILVDNSDSMNGKRLAKSKEATVVLAEVLERLDIPTFIAGHASQKALSFTIYKLFDDARNAKYAISRMAARGDNRDGLALVIAGSYLLQRPERNKLLIIISDGQPNSAGYGGDLAKQDIRSVVSTHRRQGIKTLAVAIGDDKPQIKQIYGDAYINISDVNHLPEALAKMIEKEIIYHIAAE